jgi:hypothetical protein
MRLAVIVICLCILTGALVNTCNKIEKDFNSMQVLKKVDSLNDLSVQLKKNADSLQEICDSLKAKRDSKVRIIEKMREIRLNDTFWAQVEDTTKITMLLTEVDSLWRIVETDSEIINRQRQVIGLNDSTINLLTTSNNDLLFVVKKQQNALLNAQKKHKLHKRMCKIAALSGLGIGLIIKK